MFLSRLCLITTLYKNKVNRSIWIKPRRQGYWDAAKRGDFGEEWWHENLRMSKRTFVQLCGELQPYLQRNVTNWRMPLPLDVQAAVTIWRLATNIEYRTIAALFGLGISTVCEVVHRTCHTISRHLLPQYIKLPSEQRLREIVEEFETLWGFPQVVGAVDGTHIPILKPIECPSDYYNWKECYSILVHSIVDSQGLFIDVNIRWSGKVHDVHVFTNSSFYSRYNAGTYLPEEYLWNRSTNTYSWWSCVFIATMASLILVI